MFRMFCVFSVLLSIPIFAQETFTHEGSGLSFTLPAGWTYTHQGSFFEAADPDQTLYLLFFVGKGYEAKAAINGAVDELANLIRDPKITTDITHSTINDLTQSYVEGDGLTADGEVIDWDLTCVQGTTKTMVIIAMGEIASNQKIVDGIYQSIHEQ